MVTALHRADMRVTAVSEGEAEFRRGKVERVMGIEPTWPLHDPFFNQSLTDDADAACD
jgi:hypothetical protein